MSKKNTGFLTLAVIGAALITVYYVFLFDYKQKKFSWMDSLIAITAIIGLIGGIGKLMKEQEK